MAMRASYQAPAGGLTVTVDKATLTTARGSATHRLTVWFRDRPVPLEAVVTDDEARRLLAVLGGRARDGTGELVIGE
jgi:hypothetical protein